MNSLDAEIQALKAKRMQQGNAAPYASLNDDDEKNELSSYFDSNQAYKQAISDNDDFQ